MVQPASIRFGLGPAGQQGSPGARIVVLRDRGEVDIMRPSEGHVAGSIPAGRTKSAATLQRWPPPSEMGTRADRLAANIWQHPATADGASMWSRQLREETAVNIEKNQLQSFARAASGAVIGAALCFAPVALVPAQAQSQPAAAGAAEPRPLIDPSKLKLPVPRTVQAATSLLGLGRPRLALVIGNPTIDRKTLLPAAARDAQAVAAALRSGGFVVMVREDLSATELRANLNEFRQRLEPESIALIYFVGVGNQIDGKNIVLGRSAQIDPVASGPARADAWIKGGVPVAELVNALEGPLTSPRLLMIDAAVDAPQLGRPTQPGLIEQTVPPGLMAIFSASPGGVVEPTPAPTALPSPPPGDALAIAASRFGRELVRALMTPGLNAPDVLRLTRRGVSEQSGNKQVPWIVGDTDGNEELAEAKLLDALLPSSPQDLVKDVAKQAAQESLQARRAANAASPGNTGGPGDRLPETPSSSAPARAANAAMDVATAAATTVATAAVAAKAAEAAATLAAVSTATQVAAGAAQAVGNVAARATPLAAARPTAAAPAPAPAAVVPTAPLPAEPVVARASPAAAQRPSAPLFDIPADPRTRAQSQGERPVFAPKVNEFGYAQGDTFTYRVLDGWKGQVAGSFVQAIDEVLQDGMLNANGNQLQLDPQGRTVSRITPNGRQEFQPFEDHWWNNPKRGESRDVNFREFYNRPDRKGEIEWKGDMSVGRPRSIELPAGKFDVVPIHGDGWYHEVSSAGKGSGRWNRTVWYSPKLGHPVAIDIETTNWAGKLDRRERIELVHAQKAKP